MLQVVPNCAARLVAKVNRFDGISTEILLKQLHWLRVKERIEYKLITIVFKCLHCLAPVDLTSSIVQSKSERMYKLNVPSFNCRYGERSFCLWLDPDFGMIFLYVFVPHLTWLTLRNCLKLICLKNVTTYMNLLNRICDIVN